MTHRTNAFGERYYQPGTGYDEIAELCEGFDDGDLPTFVSAQVFDVDDELYQYGGTIWTEKDEEIKFDGFQSLNDAIDWVTEVSGLMEHEIEVLDC